MYIHGSFENSCGVKWSVFFRSDKNPGVEIIINDGLSNVYFAPNAVEITTNYESSFSHIIKRSAAVNLITDFYLGDYFFGFNARDIQVLIFRELELIYAGFVDPEQYNQSYAFPHDELTINCIDALSTLEYYKYHNIKNNTIHQAYLQTADLTTTKEILNYELRTNLGTLDFVNNIASKIYWDQSKCLLDNGDIMENMQFSELLFLDSDFDACWDSEQVLNEVLQYLNLHIIQLGRDFFIYDNEYMNRIDSEGKLFKDLFSNSTLSKQITTSQLVPYTLQKSHYNSDDTNLSIAEVYNQIQIKCNLIDSEDVIESPFDDDNLTSPFPMRQIFATEAVAQGEGQRAKKAFWTFVKKGRYLVNQDDYDGVTVNDYYLQYMTNPNWVFYDGYNNNIDSYLEQDSDGNYFRQWKVPSVYPWVTGAMPSEHGLVTSILSFGVHSVSGQAIAEDDSARMPNKLDQANYIVMSINGNQKHDSTHTPTDNQLQQASPAAVYTGAVSGGVYSPPDDETTNYIVFSGTIMYQPVETTKKSYSWTDVMNMDSWGNITASHTVKYLDGEDDDDKKAYRTIKWYNTDYPTSIDDTTHYTTVDMLDPCFSNSIQKSKFFDYNYSYINGYHVGIDAIKNLGVIECEMIIGDKCLAEDYDEDGNSIYEWVNKTTGNAQGRKTFSLGINPKLGDSILGQEFKISNNITFKMNLDNAEGTAIPIKKSDNLSGKVEFKILGPVNQMWNDITRRHSTWFRSEKFYDNDKYVLSEVKNIVIKDFEAKFYSDNGGYTYNTGQDLIYMSIENDQYINKKTDIEFKINSALTSEECKQKKIKQGIRITNPVYNGEAVTQITSKVISDASTLDAKAEELYIDQYYREYSKPRLMVEVSVNSDYMKDLNEIDIYGSITKLNSLNKAFKIVGINYDSETDSRKLTLKELGEAASGSDSTGNTTTLTYTIYATGNPLTVQDPTSLTYTWTEEEDSTWYAVYTVEVDSDYAQDYQPVMGYIDKMILDWKPIMTTTVVPVVYATDDPNNPSSQDPIEYSDTETSHSTHYTENVVCTIKKEDLGNYTLNPDDFTPTDYTWIELQKNNYVYYFNTNINSEDESIVDLNSLSEQVDGNYTYYWIVTYRATSVSNINFTDPYSIEGPFGTYNYIVDLDDSGLVQPVNSKFNIVGGCVDYYYTINGDYTVSDLFSPTEHEHVGRTLLQMVKDRSEAGYPYYLYNPNTNLNLAPQTIDSSLGVLKYPGDLDAEEIYRSSDEYPFVFTSDHKYYYIMTIELEIDQNAPLNYGAVMIDEYDFDPIMARHYESSGADGYSNDYGRLYPKYSAVSKAQVKVNNRVTELQPYTISANGVAGSGTWHDYTFNNNFSRGDKIIFKFQVPLDRDHTYAYWYKLDNQGNPVYTFISRSFPYLAYLQIPV